MGIIIVSAVVFVGFIFLFNLSNKKGWDTSIQLVSLIFCFIAAAVLTIIVIASLCGALTWNQDRYEYEYTVITVYFDKLEDEDIFKNPQLYVEMIDRAKDYNKTLKIAQETYDSWWIGWTSRAWVKNFNLIELPKGG